MQIPSHISSLQGIGDFLKGTSLASIPMAQVAKDLSIPSSTKNILQAYGPLELGLFLQRPDLHRYLTRVIPYKALINVLRDWAAAQPDIETHTGPSLNELILAAGLPAFQTWSTEFLDEEDYYSRAETIGTLSAVRGYSRLRYDYLVKELESFVTTLRAARVADSECAHLAPALTGDVRFDSFRERVRSLRESRRAVYPLNYFTADVRLLDEGLALTVHSTFSRREATVSLEELVTEQGAPRCSCSQLNCVHVAVGLEALLNATEDPQSPTVARLTARLAPKWQQALVALSSEPPNKAKTEEAGTLAFVIGPRTFELGFRKELKRKQSKPKRIDRPTDYITRVTGTERRFLELMTLALAQTQSRYHLETSRFFGDALLLLEALGVHPCQIDADLVRDARVDEGFLDREIGVVEFDVLADDGDVDAAGRVLEALDHLAPGGEVAR